MVRAYALINCEDAEKWQGSDKLYRAAFRDEDGEEASWDIYNAYEEGALPPPSHFARYAAAIVTGSHYAAYDPHPWLQRLADWLRACVEQRATRIVAICFGSQIVARALGGEAGPNPSGRFVLTVEEVRALPALAAAPYYAAALARSGDPRGGDPQRDPQRAKVIRRKGTLRLIQTHGDQVTRLPPGAELLATSATAPYELWSVGDALVAVQGHPEMPCSDALEKILPTLAGNGRLTPEEAAASRAALEGVPPDSRFVLDFLQAFIDAPRGISSPPGGAAAGPQGEAAAGSQEEARPQGEAQPRRGEAGGASQGEAQAERGERGGAGGASQAPAAAPPAGVAADLQGVTGQQEVEATRADVEGVSLQEEASQAAAQLGLGSGLMPGPGPGPPREPTAAEAEAQRAAEAWLAGAAARVGAELAGAAVDLRFAADVNATAAARFGAMRGGLAAWHDLVQELQGKAEQLEPLTGVVDRSERDLAALETRVAALEEHARKLAQQHGLEL